MIKIITIQNTSDSAHYNRPLTYTTKNDSNTAAATRPYKTIYHV
jgi:hypothetical protein